jgi:hypothetical protein
MSKQLKFKGEESREIPQFGIYKPGDVVEYSESLKQTGLFSVVKSKKEGEA